MPSRRAKNGRSWWYYSPSMRRCAMRTASAASSLDQPVIAESRAGSTVASWCSPVMPATANGSAAPASASKWPMSTRAYDNARQLLSSTELDPESDWGPWLDDAYRDAQEARSLSALAADGTRSRAATPERRTQRSMLKSRRCRRQPATAVSRAPRSIRPWSPAEDADPGLSRVHSSPSTPASPESSWHGTSRTSSFQCHRVSAS